MSAAGSLPETPMTSELVHLQAASVPEIAGSSLVDAWLEGRKPSTIKGYRNDLGTFVRFLASYTTSCPPDRLLDAFFLLEAGRANELVLAYRNRMALAELSSATIARRLAAVKSIAKVARMTGRVAWSIEVEAPRHEDRRDMSGPSDKERQKLFKTIKARGVNKSAKRDKAIVALLYSMILRCNEVRSLDLADVDFAAGTLSVLRKGRREKQPRPMPPNAARALGDWVVARGREDGPLFTRCDRPSVERLTSEAIRLMLKRLAKEAGLTKSIRPHGLRHAGITKLRSLGETDRDVMALSGHSDPKMLGRYDDRKKEGARKMAQKLDAELG